MGLDSNATGGVDIDVVEADRRSGIERETSRAGDLSAYFSTWREWAAKEWALNVGKLVLLLTPLMLLLWWAYGTNPPLTKGDLYVRVHCGKMFALAGENAELYCVGTLGSAEQRTRVVHGGASCGWSSPDDGEWCFSGVDVADQQQRSLKIALFNGTDKLAETTAKLTDVAWDEGNDVRKTFRLPGRSCAGASLEIQMRFEPSTC
jgi:hypothetical protein